MTQNASTIPNQHDLKFNSRLHVFVLRPNHTTRRHVFETLPCQTVRESKELRWAIQDSIPVYGGGMPGLSGANGMVSPEEPVRKNSEPQAREQIERKHSLGDKF